LADKYAATGTHVVAVGRRKEQLDSLAAKHPGKISVKVFDISNLEKIPQFVKEVTAEHPDLGCVFLNRSLAKLRTFAYDSGVQRGFNFTKPETVDLDDLDLEWKTNYTSYIHLYPPSFDLC
jgi:short-subunit dehydrogenase involved in D-alanine esterification of teichoic acids